MPVASSGETPAIATGGNRQSGGAPSAVGHDGRSPPAQQNQEFQSTTILGAGLFEGGAFANLVAFMTGGEVFNLLAAAALLLGIVSLFPWLRRCERRIASELRRAAEEQAFRRVP